jgi:transposase InsO family protein
VNVHILFSLILPVNHLVHLLHNTELLNGEVFYTLREAQILIEEWRKHYNTKRPHSALGYRPPAPEATMEHRPIMH